MAVGLDHLLAGYGLLDDAVQHPQVGLLLPESLQGVPGKRPGDQREQGDGEQADDGQTPVDQEDDDGHTGDHEHAGDELRQAMVDGGVDVFNIVGEPAHQFPVRP